MQNIRYMPKYWHSNNIRNHGNSAAKTIHLNMPSALPPKQLSAQTCYDLTNQIQYANQMLLSNPEDLGQLQTRADAYFLLGQYEQSLADCMVIQQASKNNDRIMFIAACCYERMGKHADAIKLCHLLLQQKPDHQAAAFKLAALEKGSYESLERAREISQSQDVSFQSTNSRDSQLSASSYTNYQSLINSSNDKLYIEFPDIMQQLDEEDDNGQLFEPINNIIARIVKENQKIDESDNQRLLNDAIKARRQNDYSTAVTLLTRLIQDETASSLHQQALFNRAYCQEQLKQFQLALSDYLEFLQKDPDNLQCLFNLSCVYMKNDDNRRALQHIDKALRVLQENKLADQQIQQEEFYFQKALILKQLQRYKEAEEEASKAVQLQPGCVKYLQLRAYCSSQLGDPGSLERALADYAALLEEGTDGQQAAEALFNKGVLLLKLDRLDESTACFEKALTCQPGNQAVIKALISNYLLQQQNSKAAALAQQLPDGANDVILTRAAIYRRMKDYQSALELYAKAGDAASEGYCARKLGQYARAVLCYNRLSQLGAVDLENRGFCLARLGRYEEAIQDYTDALKLGKQSESATTYLNRALCYKQLRDLGKTRADLQRCLDIDPANDQARRALDQL